MQVGTIGSPVGLGGGAAIAGALFAQVGFIQKEVICFTYENKQDNEYIRKSYDVDNKSSRGDFLEFLKCQDMNYSEEDAVKFINFIPSKQIFKEVV